MHIGIGVAKINKMNTIMEINEDDYDKILSSR